MNSARPTQYAGTARDDEDAHPVPSSATVSSIDAARRSQMVDDCIRIYFDSLVHDDGLEPAAARFGR